MSNPLFETSPVSSVLLPGIPGGISLGGLIVVVGPNSSGKTNLLREIHAAASGSAINLVVAKDIGLRPIAQLDDYVNFYLETGDIELVPTSTDTYRKRGHQFGTQAGGGNQFAMSNLRDWHTELERHASKPLTGALLGNSFLVQVGLLECAALFVQQRFALTDSVPQFDTHGVPSSLAIQALRVNQAAQKKFSDEIFRVFRRRVWVDNSGGPTIPIKVSESKDAPSGDDRAMPDKVRSYRNIETEGEGIRSYAAMCMTLLLAQRSLCLIDEPEMCLHPPQARDIGRFIGERGKFVKGCIVVATHSSQVLRGILGANSDVTVIRLTRNKGAFRAQQVPSDVLTKAVRKPFSRSETILDGLFSDGVALCEADGDRVVYESALNTLPPQTDIRWTPVYGTGGFTEPARLYRALGVPVAVAADFDLLFKGELSGILSVLGASDSKIANLSGRIETFVKEILKRRPELSPDAAISELRPLLEGADTWDLKQVVEISSQIKNLLTRLNSLAWLKSNGIDGVPTDLRNEIEALLEEFKTVGLFLVPRGELESWVPDLMKNTTSKENKAPWATEAARRIEENGRGTNDVWDFVESVERYIMSLLAGN
jgi:hypothetical protein